MIALLVGLALADPCAREVVVARGLVVEPAADVNGMAELDLTLKLRKRRVDGIPSYSVRHAWMEWRWALTVPEPATATYSVGKGDALCEGEVVDSQAFEVDAGSHALFARSKAKRIDACRVRIVLKGTLPASPTVLLDVFGATPPGPEAPVDGPMKLHGGDLVIDVPGCL